MLGPGREFACLASDNAGIPSVESPSAIEFEFVPAGDADWEVVASLDRTQFGQSVASAGDVDGYWGDDVLVGAPFYTNPDTGQKEGIVYLYLSQGAHLDTAHAWEKSGGAKAAEFGTSVDGAGDVNGDGRADVIIGAPGYMTDLTKKVGRAFVYQGVQGVGLTIDHTWSYTGTVQVQGNGFGYAVAGAGDVNRDGFDDIVVGAPDYTDQEGVQDREGAVYVFFGSPDGPSKDPDWIIDGNQPNAWLGTAVAAAGDVNNDGYDDLIAGAPGFVHYYPDSETAVVEGAVFLFLGRESTAPAPISVADADSIAYGGQASAGFGQSVAGAGSINGDAFADVVVGASRYDSIAFGEVGAAFAFCGNGAGFDSDPCWMVLGDQIGAGFATAVGGAGDVNADGYDDVLVGAPLRLERLPDGTQPEGAAFLYFGSETGLSLWAGWKVRGDKAKTEFGASVGSAGQVVDADGDGEIDDVDGILIGAPRYFVEEVPHGAAFAFFGPLKPVPLHQVSLPLIMRNSH